MQQADMVNHPPHYTNGGIECKDAIKAAVEHLNGYEGYCTGNAIKYLWRWKLKNGAEDLDKAIFYINELKSLQGELEKETIDPVSAGEKVIEGLKKAFTKTGDW